MSWDFAPILAAASLATGVGGLLIPSFQRYSTRAVASFHRNRSTLRILRRSLSPRGVAEAMRAAAIPRYQNLLTLNRPMEIPIGIIAMNVAASALWTVGALASIYAGVIEPDLRATSSALSSVINGVATILMFLLIDPYLSGLTGDAVQGRVEERASAGWWSGWSPGGWRGPWVASSLVV